MRHLVDEEDEGRGGLDEQLGDEVKESRAFWSRFSGSSFLELLERMGRGMSYEDEAESEQERNKRTFNNASIPKPPAPPRKVETLRAFPTARTTCD